MPLFLRITGVNDITPEQHVGARESADFSKPKGRPVGAQQIGRELCVRYVLEGSIQRSGNRVRINAQLIDAESDGYIWLEKARSAMPATPGTHASLAAAYALEGDLDRAATELAEARRLGSDDRFSSIARLKAVGYFRVPKIRTLFETIYFVGLRKAGMPEE